MYINHVPEIVPYDVHQPCTTTCTISCINHVLNLYHIMYQNLYQDHQEVPLAMYHIMHRLMNHNITKMCLNMYYHHQACTTTSPRYASSIYHITHDMSQSCHTPCTIIYHQWCASTKYHKMCLKHVITSPCHIPNQIPR
jgi:glycogen synthase